MSRSLAGMFLSVLALMAGCEPPGRDAPAGNGKASDVVVFAASSLTVVLGAIESSFERDHGVDLRVSYGASSDLARQISDGAPADVYISASKAWIEQLDKADKLDGSFVVVARNHLVCIATPGSPLREPRLSGLRALFDEVEKSGSKIAIADEGVPAGDYARQAMKSVGLLDGYKARLVGQKDVRAVLKAVASGELPIGFVYATDARDSDVNVLFEVDSNLHDSIEYYGAVVAGAKSVKAAQGYLEFLRGDSGRAVLSAHGFGLP